MKEPKGQIETSNMLHIPTSAAGVGVVELKNEIRRVLAKAATERDIADVAVFLLAQVSQEEKRRAITRLGGKNG